MSEGHVPFGQDPNSPDGRLINPATGGPIGGGEFDDWHIRMGDGMAMPLGERLAAEQRATYEGVGYADTEFDSYAPADDEESWSDYPDSPASPPSRVGPPAPPPPPPSPPKDPGASRSGQPGPSFARQPVTPSTSAYHRGAAPFGRPQRTAGDAISRIIACIIIIGAVVIVGLIIYSLAGSYSDEVGCGLGRRADVWVLIPLHCTSE